MPVDLEDPAVIGFANQVNEINAFMAEQDIQPAEWHFAFSRIFGQGDLPDFNWNKGARLYSYGYGESYQQVKKAERKRLSINGEPIAEVDIQASYLTILHHLLGAPPPEADPYDIPGIPRGVVKIWVTITLGNNGFHHRWPKESKQRYAEQSKSEQADLERDHPFKSTQATILEHLPLLKDWPNCAVRWGDLQFLESCAVIDATHRLAMEYGIPALPLHDALLVPVSKANIAKEVLSECFYQKVGIRPKIAIK
ncbi:hypothetical protein EDF56_105514 [Novosphingobium sp. PhB165]|nr:hypothetical protein EDF56_105514 [Novosphingobium sp. PhB165]